MKERTRKLQDLAKQIDVRSFLDYRHYLQAIYAAARQEFGRYSYLQFAEDLNFPKTSVVRAFIKGERPLTDKNGSKITLALQLSGHSRRYWTKLIKYCNAKSLAERDKLFQGLLRYRVRADDQASQGMIDSYFSEWHIPVIRELLVSGAVTPDPDEIQSRLAFPLRRDQITKALDVLRELGLLPQGGGITDDKKIASPAEVDSAAAIRFHQQMMDLAKDSLTRIDENSRDIRAVTVRLPETAIPYLKDKIYRWALEVLEMEDHFQKGDAVIQFNVQMFPMTKPTKEQD